MPDVRTSCVLLADACRETLGQAARHFVRQAEPDTELLIVSEAGSADSVPSALPAARDAFRRITVPRDASPTRRWHVAIEACHGRHVAVWRAGDWIGSGRLREQASLLEATGASACAAADLACYSPLEARAWRFRSAEPGPLSRRTLQFRRASTSRLAWAEFLAQSDEEPVPAPIRAALRSVAAPWYVAILAGRAAGPRPDEGGGWRPVPVAEVVQGFDAEDRAHYSAFRRRAGRRGVTVPATVHPGSSDGRAEAATAPFVSCLMPTHNRRRHAPRAIRCFLAQDYPNRELIVVDDGTDPIEDLLPADDRIQYVRLSRRHSIGIKRNLGCELARGEVLLGWDDDDWHGPRRISHQVAPLAEGRADATALVTGHVLDLEQGQWWRQREAGRESLFRQGVNWGTLAWRRREALAALRFPDRSMAEDVAFYELLVRHQARVLRLPNPEHYVYIRHGSNTWRFQAGLLSGDGWEPIAPPDFFTAAEPVVRDFEAGEPGPGVRIAGVESMVLAT